MAIQGVEECVRRAKRTVDRPWNSRYLTREKSRHTEAIYPNTSWVVMGLQLVQEDLYVAPADSASQPALENGFTLH